MRNETRATMIEGAIQLLATRGVHGASLLKVLEHTGAPRGSVYHHFPGGKEELILAALDLTGQRHDRFVDQFRGTSAEEITAGYLELWRRILLRSRLESGCPILAVTVSVSAGRAAGPCRGDLPDLSTAPRRPLRGGRRSPFRRGALRDLPRCKRRGRRRSRTRTAGHRALRGGRGPADPASSGDAEACLDDPGTTRYQQLGRERSEHPQAPLDGVKFPGTPLTGAVSFVE